MTGPLTDKWSVTVTAPNGLTYTYLSDPLLVDAAVDHVGEILGRNVLRSQVHDMWLRRKEEKPHDAD